MHLPLDSPFAKVGPSDHVRSSLLPFLELASLVPIGRHVLPRPSRAELDRSIGYPSLLHESCRVGIAQAHALLVAR